MGRVRLRTSCNSFAVIAVFLTLTILVFFTTYWRPTIFKNRTKQGLELLSQLNFNNSRAQIYPKDIKMFDNPTLSQTDPGILKYLLKRHLQPPSKKRYKFQNDPDWDPSEWKEQIKYIFGNKRNGTFVEAGANDGEYMSNTLALERDLSWNGLLIEPNNLIYPALERKHRKAWIANVCLAVKPYPHKVKILHRIGPRDWYRGNGIIEPNPEVPPPPGNWNRSHYISTGYTECFPLFSILAALEMKTVDFFSLDVEGVEMKVLKTIPWDSVDIKVITLEHNVAEEGKDVIRDFLLSRGYYTYMETKTDFFFVKNGYILNS